MDVVPDIRPEIGVDVSAEIGVDAGCPGVQVRCGTTCMDLTSNNTHCGRCGNTCVGGETCNAGLCECPMGGRSCGGTCVDVETSNTHCGACNSPCSSMQTCVGGSCQCPTGQMLCGDTCVVLNTSATHCGRCGNICAPMTVCSAGECRCTRAMNTLCGSTCVDLQNDPQNCGVCGNVCGDTSRCSAGRCSTTAACTAPMADCDGNMVNGCETNTATSVANCGGCGVRCMSPNACAAGICTLPRSCRELLSLHPMSRSGTYLIVPESGTTQSVWCDMDTAGGGWTVIYLWNGTHSQTPQEYTINDSSIRRASTETLMAYRNRSYGIADTSWAWFPIPSNWQTRSPFMYDSVDQAITIHHRTGTQTGTLRYGFFESGNDCASNWNNRLRGGRICISNTSAPFYNEFVSPTYIDLCPNSDQDFAARRCSDNRRFSIAVR
jgi:hypothetical protein